MLHSYDTNSNTKSNIILLYNVHTTDHIILVLLNVLLWYWHLVRMYARASAAGCLQKFSVVDVKKES